MRCDLGAQCDGMSCLLARFGQTMQMIDYTRPIPPTDRAVAADKEGGVGVEVHRLARHVPRHVGEVVGGLLACVDGYVSRSARRIVSIG